MSETRGRAKSSERRKLGKRERKRESYRSPWLETDGYSKRESKDKDKGKRDRERESYYAREQRQESKIERFKRN